MVPAEVSPKGLAPGEKFGRYVIEGLLGAGGMASVYRALDTALGRVVALKVLHRPGDAPIGTPASSGGNQRIQREARALAALEHPNVVAVYDVGEVAEGTHAGTAYLTMELVRGRSLLALIRSNRPPIDIAIRWLGDAARGLAAAHRTGVIHRDVKPDNILVRDDGVLKVLDFGIAKSTVRPSVSAGTNRVGETALSTITREGVVLGTPYFMSPEQMRGDRVDARSDQFSWAVVAYQVLTGETPWGAGLDAVSLVARILRDTPRDVRDENPAVPPWLSATIDRALSKDPEARFASMDDIVAAFELGDAAQVPTASSHASGRDVSSNVARWRRVVLASVALAVTAFVVVVLLERRTNAPPASAPPAVESVIPVTPVPLPRPSIAPDASAGSSRAATGR